MSKISLRSHILQARWTRKISPAVSLITNLHPIMSSDFCTHPGGLQCIHYPLCIFDEYKTTLPHECFKPKINRYYIEGNSQPLSHSYHCKAPEMVTSLQSNKQIPIALSLSQVISMIPFQINYLYYSHCCSGSCH